ncbi:hypothetical protein V8B97DRAFT_1977184 [Scleroderma yunnanense]
MSSYNGYTTAPQSPTFGFFPTAPSAPHAFSSFHADPRDAHAMYASLGSYTGSQSGPQAAHTSGSQNPLRRLCRK